nr:cytochrome P450 [Spodoptera frugiperda]
MILTLIWVVVLIAAAVLFLRQAYATFDRYEIKYFKALPILSDMVTMIRPKEHIGLDLARTYNSFPNERFVGKLQFLKETIIVRDPELIKKMTVKDYEYFLNHPNTGPPESIFSKFLLFMKGEEWKEMRSTLSPAFTSSKIRLMVPFMEEVGDQMILSLKKKIENSKDGYIDIECKDLTTRYANDVIATCAFGLKVDSHNDENNQFYSMGKILSAFSLSKILLYMILTNVPYVMEILDWDFIPKSAQRYFKNLVLDTMKNRELQNIVRPDMIHLLMEAKKGKLKHEDEQISDEGAGFATVEESSVGKKALTNKVWTDDDLVAQAFLFFIAGFESVSSSMSFLLHELALNPDVQERLVQEIKEHDEKNGGKVDFTSIQSMKYMDMVVSEVLRLWPPFVMFDRECTRDYNLGKPNDSASREFVVRKGVELWIPTYAIHRDPQYFPDPDKFDPERFSDENKHKIKPFTYTPFGTGPRNCIGSRFALCELKVMAYQLLRHVELSPCEKTCIPAKLSTDTFNLKLEGGHWLRFRLRK